MVVGGAMPVGEVLKLEAIDPLKQPIFLRNREIGMFNVGGPGIVKVGDAQFELDFKEALYLGSGDREVTFESKDEKNPAKFYFNSLTAHRNYPDKKVTKGDAVVAEMGSLEGSNHRNINKMIVNQVLPTCQIQMGMTELAPGSVWNTMPAHVHSRRMEAYFYFEVPEDQAVCHFMRYNQLSILSNPPKPSLLSPITIKNRGCITESSAINRQQLLIDKIE